MKGRRQPQRGRARALALAALIAACLVPAAWGAMDAQAPPATTAPEPSGRPAIPPVPVSIQFSAYDPAQIDVLAGETVSWTNDSSRQHTVTADDGSFDSGVVAPTSGFVHRFEASGSFPYHCTIHPFIRGEVDVYALLLKRPIVPAGPDRPFPLAGRTALDPDTPITIQGDSGEGFVTVADTTAGPDGRFAVTVTPHTTTTYRAVSGDNVSPPVQLLVLDHKVQASAVRARRAAVVSAVVTPAAPGSTAVLQLHLRQRFGWWPVAQAKLDRSSRVRFKVPLGHRVPARVVLTLPDGATILATSPTIAVGPRR